MLNDAYTNVAGNPYAAPVKSKGLHGKKIMDCIRKMADVVNNLIFRSLIKKFVRRISWQSNKFALGCYRLSRVMARQRRNMPIIRNAIFGADTEVECNNKYTPTSSLLVRNLVTDIISN